MISQHSNMDLFQTQDLYNKVDPAHMPALRKLDGLRGESMDNLLWATAQGLALAKLKVFHTMAKSVNDQQ